MIVLVRHDNAISTGEKENWMYPIPEDSPLDT